MCCSSWSLFLPLLLLVVPISCFPPCVSSSIGSYHVNKNKNNQAPPNNMDPSEAETLFNIMDSMSSDHTWRISFPNPCNSASSWPGIECKPGQNDKLLHVSRLDFGSPPNPSCKTTATFPSQVFTLPYLQSLFFFIASLKPKPTFLSLSSPTPPMPLHCNNSVSDQTLHLLAQSHLRSPHSTPYRYSPCLRTALLGEFQFKFSA